MAPKSTKNRSKNDAKKMIKKSALNKFGVRCRTALGGPLEYNYTPLPRDNYTPVPRDRRSNTPLRTLPFVPQGHGGGLL